MYWGVIGLANRDAGNHTLLLEGRLAVQRKFEPERDKSPPKEKKCACGPGRRPSAAFEGRPFEGKGEEMRLLSGDNICPN